MDAYTMNKQKISKKINQVSKNIAQRSVQGVKDSVDVVTHKVKDVTDSAFDNSIEYIKTHPIKSVLGAFSLGYTLGRVAARTFGSSK